MSESIEEKLFVTGNQRVLVVFGKMWISEYLARTGWACSGRVLMFCMKRGFECRWKRWPAIWEHKLLHCDMREYIFPPRKTTTCVWPPVKSSIYFTATRLFCSLCMSGMSLISLQQDDTEIYANLKGRKGLISKTLSRKFILIKKKQKTASYIHISKVQWIQALNMFLKLVLTTAIFIFIFCCQSFSMSICITFFKSNLILKWNLNIYESELFWKRMCLNKSLHVTQCTINKFWR